MLRGLVPHHQPLALADALQALRDELYHVAEVAIEKTVKGMQEGEFTYALFVLSPSGFKSPILSLE